MIQKPQPGTVASPAYRHIVFGIVGFMIVFRTTGNDLRAIVSPVFKARVKSLQRILLDSPHDTQHEVHCRTSHKSRYLVVPPS